MGTVWPSTPYNDHTNFHTYSTFKHFSTSAEFIKSKPTSTSYILQHRCLVSICSYWLRGTSAREDILCQAGKTESKEYARAYTGVKCGPWNLQMLIIQFIFSVCEAVRSNNTLGQNISVIYSLWCKQGIYSTT